MRLNLVLFAILVSCALGVVTAQYKVRKLFVELQKDEEVARHLDVEWGRLQLEQSTWATPARVEQIASGDLGMKVPAPNRIQPVFPVGGGK